MFMKNTALKNKNRRIFSGFLYSALFAVTLIVYSACPQNVALGGSVDILPPNGEITYPDAGETPIRGSFVLKGTAKDDEGVQAVSIVFENIETKDRTRSFQAELSAPGAYNTSWTANIDNKSTGTEAGHDLVKVYPIPDGEYTAIVTVTDNGGKTSKFTKNYKIDNTPPVFIVSRPSTAKPVSTDPETGDKYGAVFSVEGQAGERNTVSKLSVEVPEKNLSASEMFVGKNINAQLFTYGEADADAWYDYQKNELHNKAIKAQLFLYDNAQKFSDGTPEPDGNKSEFFYLQEDIQNTVLKKGYTEEVISDYFAGKKGSDKNEHDKKIKALREDTTALNALKDNRKMMDGSTAERSTFKLDPNKSPGYKIIGVRNLAKNSLDLSAASTIIFKSGNISTLLAELIPNKDGDPLVSPNTVDAYKNSGIKIVLVKWNGTGNETDSFKTDNNLVQEAVLFDFAGLNSQADLDNAITKEGSNLRVKFNLPASFTEGKRAIKVIGTDSTNQVSNTFEAYDDSNSVNNGLYICNFLSTGSGPRIRPVRIEGFKNKNFDIFADITDLEPGTAYYKIGGAATVDSNRKLERPDPVGAPARYKATLDISTLTDGEYELHFLAKANSGSEDKDKITFSVDKTPPEIKLTYPEATVAQAGEVSFTGTISDAGAGVDASKTKFLIAKKSVGTVDENTAGWQNMATSTAGSWNFKYNFNTMTNPSDYGTTSTSNSNYFDIPIYILAEDNIGNKKVHKLTMILNPDGTKPIVRILSPVNNAVLGGTIQIFGTTSVAIGSPSDIGKAYIQFSKDGSFSNTTDGTFGSVDWYNGGNGKIVDNTTANGAVQWTQTINQDQSFNPNGNDNQPVYFRVCAENKATGQVGEWTEKIKIEIDKSSPTIGSPDAVKIVKTAPAVSLDYVPRMWIGENMILSGSLHDESGIKTINFSGDLENGATYDLTQSGTTPISHNWIEQDSAHNPSSGTKYKNYKLKIPLNLNNLKAQAKAKGEFTVKIRITDADNKPTEKEFTFRFDTENPIGDFGTNKYMNIGNFTSSSITDTQLAQKVRELGGTTSSGGGCKILAENSVLSVTNVTGNKVAFTASPALTAGSYSYILYKPETLIYKNSSGKWTINGVANDSGSGVKEVKAKATVNEINSAETTMTETDPQNRITTQLGGTVTWQGKIDFGSVPDGKGKLYYTITDKSGNTYTAPGVDVVVKNNPIAVQKITLMTDIGGTQKSFISDNLDIPSNKDANLDFTANFASSGFAFKNKDNSKIKVEFTGGQGTVKYRLKKIDGGTQVNIGTGNLTAITTGNTIDLKNHFGTGTNQIGNSNGTPTTIILELWDEAHGFTQGTDSAFAKVNITTLFDTLDDKAPTVVVLPFYWNGEGKDSNNNPLNSLYEGSRANGHVEIASVSGTGNTYSSVSGKVSISGFAYDNIKINTLEASLPNTTALTVKATRQANGTWTSDKNMASHGAVLTVETLDADYLGYYVKWRLDWNTEKAGVGVAKSITVSANDGTNTSVPADGGTTQNATVTRGTPKTAEGAVFANKNPGQFVVFKKGETQYLTRIANISDDTATLVDTVPTDADEALVYGYTANKAKTSVNVVPYITNVETGLTSADSGFKGAFSRASTGEYPVRAGETIKVKGFNLAGGTVMLGAASLGTNLNSVSITDSHTSGALSVKVGSVESINNKIDVSKPYNIEANNANNNILTVRRKLFVWKTKPIINNNFMESPQFVMDKASNYYMSYGILAVSGNLSFAMMKNATITTPANMASSHIIEQCFSKYQNTVIAYDESGNMYGGASNTDRATRSTSFTFFSREQGTNATGTTGNYDGGTNRRRLENNANEARNVYDVNRVQIPKLAVRGPGSDAKVALIYCDRNNDVLPIKFRYGSVTAPDNISNGLGHNVDSYGIDSDPNDSGSARGYEVVADTASEHHQGGGYAAVGLTSTNRAVVVWYDAAKSQLVYSYRDIGTSYTEPAAGATDRKTSEWQANAVEIDGGAPLYVDLVIDDEDGLHIGYYSSGNGGVRYAYLAPGKVNGSTKPATSDFKIATVDTYMNPGTFLKMGVRKENNKQVPYISYYHNGFYGSANAARIAWLKDGLVKTDTAVKNGVVSNKFTGDWVVMTVPASNGIQQYTICQGAPTSGTYANKVIAAYFTTKDYEMAVLEK